MLGRVVGSGALRRSSTAFSRHARSPAWTTQPSNAAIFRRPWRASQQRRQLWATANRLYTVRLMWPARAHVLMSSIACLQRLRMCGTLANSPAGNACSAVFPCCQAHGCCPSRRASTTPAGRRRQRRRMQGAAIAVSISVEASTAQATDFNQRLQCMNDATLTLASCLAPNEN